MTSSNPSAALPNGSGDWFFANNGETQSADFAPRASLSDPRVEGKSLLGLGTPVTLWADDEGFSGGHPHVRHLQLGACRRASILEEVRAMKVAAELIHATHEINGFCFSEIAVRLAAERTNEILCSAPQAAYERAIVVNGAASFLQIRAAESVDVQRVRFAAHALHDADLASRGGDQPAAFLAEALALDDGHPIVQLAKPVFETHGFKDRSLVYVSDDTAAITALM
jgi:hypothetical protein